jgi:hypothetical protein
MLPGREMWAQRMRILQDVAAPAAEGVHGGGAEIGGDTKGPYRAITDGLLTAGCRGNEWAESRADGYHGERRRRRLALPRNR